jgi:hypothetical protein
MDTLDRFLSPLAATVSRPDRVFPTLTPAQIARIAPMDDDARSRPVMCS